MTEAAAPSILVIEDDEDVSFAVKATLELQGYAVETAKNGQEALNLLQNERMPNLILLDMKMPIVDGWQFSAEFNKQYDSSAPIVVMTAAADAKKRADQVTSNAWIEKPFTIDALLDVVKKNIRSDQKQI